MTKPRSHWVNTVSRDHGQAGVEGGFTQAAHGQNIRLKHLAKGDLLVFYSPKTSFKSGEPLQAFTALGELADAEPYQVEMTAGFHPWRRKVAFKQSSEALIRPLIDTLDFIENKKRWGFPFRRGLFEIAQADFGLIASAMNVSTEAA